MSKSDHVHLTRRERQIMDVLYARGEASASLIHQQIPDSPSYSAVRALLKKLLDKGHVQYHRDGARYIYTPVVAKNTAQNSAVRRLLDTFFDGSPKAAVMNLLGAEGNKLSADDVDAIEAQLRALKADEKR